MNLWTVCKFHIHCKISWALLSFLIVLHFPQREIFLQMGSFPSCLHMKSQPFWLSFEPHRQSLLQIGDSNFFLLTRLLPFFLWIYEEILIRMKMLIYLFQCKSLALFLYLKSIDRVSSWNELTCFKFS